MKLLHKFGTAVRLVRQREWDVVARQSRLLWCDRRLRFAGQRPFVYRAAGAALVCFPDLPESIEQYREPGDDRWELDLIAQSLRPGHAFIDVGANLGLYSQAIASRCERVRVLAIEPSPMVASRFLTAVQLLGLSQVALAQVLAGAEAGATTFYLARQGTPTTLQSMSIDPDHPDGYEGHVLPVQRLADLATQHLGNAPVDAVKIDFEGAEPLVLAGAPPAWFAAEAPLWVIEINPDALGRMHFTPAEILRHFDSDQFDRWLVPKCPYAGEPLRPRRLTEGEAFADARYYNFIAIPRGDEFRERRARLQPWLR